MIDYVAMFCINFQIMINRLIIFEVSKVLTESNTTWNLNRIEIN